MKSKILHIVYSGLGGTTDYVFNLIKGDIDGRSDHYILFYGIEEIASAQLAIAKSLSKGVFTIQKEAGIDKRALKEVEDILLAQRFKAISLHVNSLILLLPKLMPKETKLIFVEHQSNQLKTRKEWLWSILAQRKSDVVISLTDDYQSELKAKLRFLFKKVKNQIIRTGLQLSDYEPSSSNSEILKIGMISRINDLKDHKTLIKAFEAINHPSAELHIAGDGETLEQLKNLSKSDKTIFRGLLSSTEIKSFLKELSIYVQATKGETSSIAVMQAQCSALPIIASNVKGINNVLNKDNAVLVELENVKEMQAAISTMISSSERREKMAVSSLTYAKEHLDNKNMLAQFEKLI